MTYKISYRDIKYPRLEFGMGELLLVLPFDHDPDAVLEKHKVWVRRKVAFIEECLRDSADKEIAHRTDGEFKDIVRFYIEQASEELGVRVNKIFFRRMKTKWASCSSRRNLTANTLMKHLPEWLIEYVIFHEIAHIIEKRHGDKFWNIISNKFDDCSMLERELFAYWFLIQEFEGLGGVKWLRR